jgi:chromosome partitioning protein
MPLLKIISLVNQKGGVGKTTTAINLSSALGILEQRVLLIDADPQANATTGLGVLTKTVENSIVNLFKRDKATQDCIIETHSPNLKIIPGSIKLAQLAMNLENSNINRLKSALDEIKHLFDFIIIDCSPSIGYLTLNTLVASDAVIIPVQCDYFALKGLNRLLATIESVKTTYNSKLSIEGILVTMFDNRIRLHKQVVKDLKTYFKDLIFNTVIKRNISLSEAPGYGFSVLSYNINSEGSTNYLNLSREIIKNQMLMKTNFMPKKLPEIINDNNEDLIFTHKAKVRNLDAYRSYSTNDKNYEKLKGLSKREVISHMGLMYNDLHSNIWMYRTTKKIKLLKKNYLYLYFDKNRVEKILTKRFKFS